MKVATVDNITGNIISVYWTYLTELQQPAAELNQTNININELTINDQELLRQYVYRDNTWIKRPDNLPRYYVYVNGSWQDSRSISDIKAVAMGNLLTIVNEKSLQNIEYLGNTYQPNIPLIQDYYINNLANPNYTVEWLDINNVAHTLSLNDLAQILQQFNTKQEENFQIYQQLKQQINNAQTIAEVEAVTWPQ